MTNIERVNEITAELKSFSKDRYCREEILPELFALQDEMVNLTLMVIIRRMHSSRSGM